MKVNRYKALARVFVPGRMPGLNDYIAAMNRNRHIGNAMKQENTDRAAWMFKGYKPITEPVLIQFLWHETNTRRDPDNIIFAKKFILDGMVKAGILPNDTQEWIMGFKDYIIVDKQNPGVWITVMSKENTDVSTPQK